jgi:hypothetical protein
MIVAFVGTKCFEVKRADYFTDEEFYRAILKVRFGVRLTCSVRFGREI